MNMLKYLSLALLVHLSVGQNKVVSSRDDLWSEFVSKHGTEAKVRWNEVRGVPVYLHDFRAQMPTGNNPEVAAKAFLLRNYKLLGMKSDLSDVEIIRSQTLMGISVVDFQQSVARIPVLNGTFSVALKAGNEVFMFGGTYVPNDLALVEARIPAITAIERTRSHLGLSSPGSDKAELGFLPIGKYLRLVYMVDVDAIRTLVDADNGRVIRSVSRGTSETGFGTAYLQDPVNSSMSYQSFPHLLGDGTKLDGSYVRVINQELGEYSSYGPEFLFYPPAYTQHDGTHFDDANVYYHVDKAASQYWTQQSCSWINFKITAYTHRLANSSHDNAAYDDDGSKTLHFGHGYSTFWDSAKKNDIIYHEYTHAVSDHMGLPGGSIDSEIRAVHEAYSDYHTAAFTNDSEIAEWWPRDSENYPFLRNIQTSPSVFHYSRWNVVEQPMAYATTEHANGLILSGALWDIRNALGASRAWIVTTLGLYLRHTGEITYLDIRDGIVLAENDAGGQYVQTIENIFDARAIRESGAMVTITGPSTVVVPPKGSPGNQYQWAASVGNGTQPYVYRWLWNGSDLNTTDTYSKLIEYSGSQPSGYATLTLDMIDYGGRLQTATKQVYVYVDNEEYRVVSGPSDRTPENVLPFSLYESYPNPFNPSGSIRFSLKEDSRVSLMVFDILGRSIKVLKQGDLSWGVHTVNWDGLDDQGSPAKSGVYFCVLRAESYSGDHFAQTRKLVLLR